MRMAPRTLVAEPEDTMRPVRAPTTPKHRRFGFVSALSLSAVLLVGACACDVADTSGIEEEPGEDGNVPGGTARTMGVGINIGFYNPEAGLKVFKDGYNTATWSADDEPFHEDFLRDMAPFETIRFHQFHLVSFSNEERWSDRTPPDVQVHLTGYRDIAMPYEWEIRLSNTLGTHYWLNTPAKADSAYLAELAALVHAQLDPSRSGHQSEGSAPRPVLDWDVRGGGR